MRKSMKEAIGTTVQDMIRSGINSSFTQKDLNALGIKIPEVAITAAQIKGIREKRHLSQTVFAQLLNVSPSSVRQWEQGKRIPSGSTKVLLELLNRSPHILDYRIS
ncbi:MAG: helix-turn-helix domain-containing protein [Desulfobacula sp.]|nr:helix-turn-helix domain-containing protein [Desulfobacula sp.]